jgi:DNA-binding protein HU-beta
VRNALAVEKIHAKVTTITESAKGEAMAKSVSKADLIDMIAEKTGLTKKDVKMVADLLFDHISSNLKKSVKVQITGFGTFEIRKRKARTGVRPGTTEPIKIPASKYPAFKAGKALKEEIK